MMTLNEAIAQCEEIAKINYETANVCYSDDGFSYKGDTVLDPFSGSGTTCYVAKSLGRKFIGFELSEAYWNESISRLNGVPYKVTENTNPYGAKKENKKVGLW